ncbi:LysM peptidoglycan-binding domain-containing protein [Paenibacillus sp. SI8]|uniref:LysM peptidoglycan-binding domain-containing protein n=1 Tax=unclassified Paenibacillus TaxID=185978 RepID=UPI003465FAC1
MKIHIVKKGDSLYELAKKYHVDLDQVIALNPQLADPNVLSIGEKVKIPSSPKPVEPPSSEYVYKHIVQQGDSLWKLGKAWDIPLQAMIQANPQLKNPNVLMTGELVFIPKIHADQAQGQEHSHHPDHSHGHEHWQQAPLPGHSHKKSTAPFVEQPIVQQAAPAQPIQPPLTPYLPIMESPSSEAAPEPAEAPEAAPELPNFTMPTQEAPAQEPAQEPEQTSLNEPYMQPAVHPFHQFHIQATEVSVYPSQEPADVSECPEFVPYPLAPWEHGHYPMETNQIPVSSGGCGCGGSHYAEQPWQTFPAGMPAYTAEEPWHTFPQTFPTADGYFPEMSMGMTSPIHMQHVPHYPVGPDFYTPHHGMVPHYETPYPTPYESPMLPQVHTHQLAEETDKEETVEIDIRPSKKSERAVKSKKTRLLNTAAINSALKRQQNQVERSTPKPNLPWINV